MSSQYALVIKTKNGATRAVVEKWRFFDGMMQEQYVMCTVRSEKPISFAVGDYCVFRGKTYTLNYIPSVRQKASIGTSLEAFVYEDIKFNSPGDDETARCTMRDITSSTYDAILGSNHTGSTVFQLYCGETHVSIGGVNKVRPAVSVLAAKMQVCMDAMYGVGVWTFEVDTDTYQPAPHQDLLTTHTDDQLLSFNNNTVAEALAMVHDVFDLNYSIQGRHVYIGFALKNLVNDDDAEVYRMGYGKGYSDIDHQGHSLFEIVKTSDSSQQIVTRMRAMGSTKNIPFHYYYKRYGLVSQALFPANLQLPGTFLPEGDPTDTPDAQGYTKWARNNARSSALNAVLGPANDSYIEKGNNAAASDEGVREGSVVFDGSGDVPEIYPTIEGVKISELRDAGVPDQDEQTGQSAYPNYNGNERIDELLAIGHYVDGTLTDDANVGDGVLTESEDNANAKKAVVAARVLTFTNGTGYNDFHWSGNTTKEWRGPSRKLFSVQDVSPGNYFFTPQANQVPYFIFRVQRTESWQGMVKVKYRIEVVQTNKNTGVETTIFSYTTEAFASIYENCTGMMEMTAFPVPLDGQTVPSSLIQVTAYSDITVNFIPVLQLSETGSTHINFTARVNYNPENDKYEPIYIWKGVSDATASEDFHLFVKDMGFNIEAQFGTDTPKLSMKSGSCMGREFEILSGVEEVTYEGKKGYMLRLARAKDDGLGTYYPSSNDTIQAGDRFVLTGINLPDAYIEAAEVRLLDAATEWLSLNSVTRFIYQPVLDDIFLQRNYDRMVAAGQEEDSIFWRLYAGMKFSFFGIPIEGQQTLPEVDITIESVQISMGEGLTPKVELKLNDDIQQSTLKKITRTVDRIANETMFNRLEKANVKHAERADTAHDLDPDSPARQDFLSKRFDDTAKGRIGFNRGIRIGENYQPGLMGAGAAIDENGYGEMRGLKLWEWLEVPELRYNRVSIYTGIRWDTFGGGIIDTVEPNDGSETGTCTLHLEDGEVGAIAVGDLCMGIWHDQSGNAQTTSDDNRGNFLFAGFKTVYFLITSVSGDRNETFTYVLRGQNEGGNGIHPFEGMHFAGRGNVSNIDRQAFIYSTTRYSVALTGVNTWEFQPSNYYYIRGHLDGFSMPAIDEQGQPYLKTFSGVGVVMGNAYIFGEIDQFERLGYHCEIDQSLNGSLAPGETETVTVTVKDGYNADKTSQFTHYSVVRNTGDAASDAVWNAQHTSVTNPFQISFNDLGIDGIRKLLAVFTVTATDEVSGVSAASAEANYYA